MKKAEDDREAHGKVMTSTTTHSELWARIASNPKSHSLWAGMQCDAACLANCFDSFLPSLFPSKQTGAIGSQLFCLEVLTKAIGRHVANVLGTDVHSRSICLPLLRLQYLSSRTQEFSPQSLMFIKVSRRQRLNPVTEFRGRAFGQ